MVALCRLTCVAGFGSSAIVYHTTYTPLNCPVSVKMIDLDHFERNQIDELRREIQVMTLCKHPNLLKIHASFVHKSKLWIVTPYLSGGSCLDIMKTGFRDGFEEVAIATILVQALQGLDYLHKNGHIHRDIKAGNLLVDADGTVQLADFGVSSSLMEDMERRGMRKTFVGTPCWMAPEVMEMTKGYDVKADIWSFGITALELAYGHAPFAKYPPMKVIYLTLSSAPPSLDRKRCRHKYSKTFKEMIDMCLQKDAARRPSAEQLLKHPFFRQAKKKSHLASTLLSTIPCLEQRPRVTKLMKQMSHRNDYNDSNLTDWDFSEESGSEADFVPTDELSTLPDTPNGTDNESSGMALEGSEGAALVAATSVGDKKFSRFVVEPQGSKCTSTVPSPKEADKDNNSRTSPNAAALNGENGEDPGIKKGRFSVLESASPNNSDGSHPPFDANSTGPSPSAMPVLLDGEAEDGRRSRFQVETSISVANLPPIASENPTQPASPAQGSRFHVSQTDGGSLHRDRSQDSIPAPFPRGVDLRSGILYDGDDLHGSGGASEFPREYNPHQMGPHPFGHVPPPHHRSSQIFVHPSQIDQLLLLNELIRQQLMELRNLSSAKRFDYGVPFGASSSYQGTVHGGDQFYGDAAAYWETGLRGPGMVEDPHINVAPSYSAYSSSAEHYPWPSQFYESSHPPPPPHPPHHHHHPRTYDARPMGYTKRRSISIDHRHFHQPHNPPPQPSGLQQSHRLPNEAATLASSRSIHRNVQSLKSPVSAGSNPSSSDPFSTLDSLKRELDFLKRENEQLRKR